MNKIIVLVLSLVLFTLYTNAQGTRYSIHSVGFNYLQLKEGMNYGLVFRGPGLSYTYSSLWENDWCVISYDAMFGLTYMQTRTLPGANMTIVPVKLDWLFKNIIGDKLMIGPNFLAEYNYQLYPDLQSMNSFWFTQYTIGGILQYNFRINRQLFVCSVSTSFFGLTSRQPEDLDPYFWDLSGGDIIRNFHQDLKFGVASRYKSSELEMKWSPGDASRFSLSWCLSYTDYCKAPNLKLLNNSLKLTVRPKSK